ncbi:RNA polymerase sigma factor [Actinorhabdospora filicis]|uniref:RNA polymerase sigma factor n=1 Tax=Actinorhabdospora filicis TaxID=1785913 RepID=A0A9W6STW3_9ACTN|nr:RNA polymerase sigma factor SigJ [Actinorhabdospora filicis]GLZ81752.1 RNA polymerase sigma factor [Actinorhabdospora filicis]
MEDPELGAVMAERRKLINLGYRLLGSLSEAEDVVQETYARWYAMSGEQRAGIASPGAWLTTVAGRICLDLLGSARARRERYVGSWVPEPLPGDGESDPADRVTLDESVDMAFLVVLESMTPAERVAFILHDVFCHPFAEIAEVIGRSPAACRQLAASARRRVRDARPAATPFAGRASVVRDFKKAWEAKDIAALVGLLDPGAVAVADGGGLVNSVMDPVEGAAKVARYAVGILDLIPTMRFHERTVNGRPGLVAEHDGEPFTVIAFDIDGDRIRRMWAVRNPEKLRAWAL